MGLNSGSRIFLFILIGALAVLIISLVIVGVVSKKKGVNGFAKFIVVILSIINVAAFTLFPLSYFNMIDINLKFGNYSSVNDSSLRLHIHKSAAEYRKNYTDYHGTWTLKNDILTIYFPSETLVYEVKDMGTKLYKDGQLVFKYLNEREYK